MEASNGIRERMSTNLKTLMKQSGMKSQAQLAGVTGISQAQISNILRAEKGASIDVLERLSKGLGCDPWVLLSPVDYVDAFNNSDLRLLVHCYLRLRPNDQDALKGMSQQLYEATHSGKPYWV